MDTLAVQTEVDRFTWDRIARTLRQRSVRGTDGRESRKAYGSFFLSRPTLYLSQSPTTTLIPTCRVVLEFCPGKVMRGHNVYASELCARTAMGFVLDEVEGRTGACLHDNTFIVCRFDAAHTFLGVEATAYLNEAAKYTLVRRERVVYEHGVGYKAKSRSELIYDKRAEVHHILDELPAARSEDGELKELGDLVPSTAGPAPGRVDGAAGLAEAARLVEGGALRVECRVKGSPNVARALDLVIPGTDKKAYYPATFDRVVRDASTYVLLSAFLTQFNFGASVSAPDAIGRLREAGHTGSRVLQLLGFRELEKLVGTDRQAYRALGLSPARRRSLRRDLHASGIHRLGEPGASLRPLVVTRDDLAEIRKIDEGDTKSWQARRTDWGNSWELRSHELALLAG